MEGDNTELLIDQQIKLLLREILIEKIEKAIVSRIQEREEHYGRRTKSSAH
jgi:hypothetical protein